MKLSLFPGPGKRHLGFEIEMLLAIATELSLKLMLRFSPCLFKISAFDQSGYTVKLLPGQRFIDGEDRFQILDYQVCMLPGPARRSRIFSCNHRNRLPDVLEFLPSKERFVRNDIAERVLPW